MQEKKVYEYNTEKVKTSIVNALKRHGNETTVADIITLTGLPEYQVQETIKHVVNEYDGHMKVSESGELLYYFPRGMRSTVRGFIPTMKRIGRKLLKAVGKILAFLFKIWIVVMLVGYFLVFLAILLLAMCVSFAGGRVSSGSSDDRRESSFGGGIGGMILTRNVLDLFIRLWFYSSLVKDPRQKKQGRPLHKSVFAFVFGEKDPNADYYQAEKQHLVRYIQMKKGVITLEELMAETGRTIEEANALINSLLIEWEGEPKVTEDGSLYYEFSNLLRQKSTIGLSATELRKKSLIPFSNNEKKVNRLVGFFNGFNLVFGSYFLFSSFGTQVNLAKETASSLYEFVVLLLARSGVVAEPVSTVTIGLGVIPVIFSALFFLIPIIRNLRLKTKNIHIKQGNLLRRIYTHILRLPLSVRDTDIRPQAEDENPPSAGQFISSKVKEFAAYKGADVETEQNGGYVYVFKELDREIKDIESLRRTIDLSSFDTGKIVFDSGK